MVFLARLKKVSLAPNNRYLLAVAQDENNVANLWWFRSLKWFQQELGRSTYWYIYGKPQLRNNRFNFTHPDIWPASDPYADRDYSQPEEDLASEGKLGIVPAYRPLAGLSGQARARLVRHIAENLKDAPPLFPDDILRNNGLAQPIKLLSVVHGPPRDARGKLPKPRESRAWQGLSTLELAFWRLVILASSPEGLKSQAPHKPDPRAMAAVAKMWEILPFEPSPEQSRVTMEILSDMASPRPMSRLLQGEVGCGKTAVAAATAVAALALGQQVALMAPTEVLIRQHHEFFLKLGEALGFQVHFLAGKQRAAERRAILDSLETGAPSVTVGTHALSFPAARIPKLALAIIDEQHRFGVKQRLALRDKCPGVNILSLSATPIPSSLATILYGDSAISSMTGILPGRPRAITRVFAPHETSLARNILADMVRGGEQAFVVCPMIETQPTAKAALKAASDVDNYAQEEEFPMPLWPGNYVTAAAPPEVPGTGKRPMTKPATGSSAGPGAKKAGGRPEVKKVAQEIQSLLPGHKVGLLHGRLSPEEKQEAMANFKGGLVRVLVATTMVEVGVDVPAANVMLIEGADWFGLAQLHQLRGRVGRGGGQGHFFLVPSGMPNEVAQARLEAIEAYHDGYRLAELDLKLRGPGEELGLRQSGWPRLDFAKLPNDLRLLPKAFALAQELWLNRHRWVPQLSECLEIARKELAQDDGHG
jgi:ATP-dependent DNA helicase RecG